MDRSENIALIALLQNRPKGMTWQELTTEIVAAGSAINVWEQLNPAGLFDGPGRSEAFKAAAADLQRWDDAGIQFVTILDASYPTRLRAIHQAPPALFARGTMRADDIAVSVVGSRRASERGVAVAAEITRALVSNGITAVAGLAAGIDSAVHRAALQSDGRTVAVIGTGINRYYPASNRGLQNEISARGLVMSQFWPDAPPQKHTFLMRNATMSGYGLATIVVEAGETSGTRAQARMAVEHGRTVILTDSVIKMNEWARQLEGRPGVYRADSLADVVDIVRKLSHERLDASHQIDELIANAL